MAIPSFPSVHTTGPVHHYVRTADASSIYYLGTAEVSPKMQVQRAYVDVINDKSGPILPHQRIDAGESAVIGVMLTDFSKSALSAVMMAGAIKGLRTGPAIGGGLSRGSLVFGQQTFELWQVFDFYGTTQATPGLEPGRYWPQVTLVAPQDEQVGTSGAKVMAVFDAQPQRVPRNGNTPGSFILARWDTDAFPADVLLPQG